MSTPETPEGPAEPREGWTRRQTLALVPAVLVVPHLAEAEPRPMPRPEPEDRPGRGAPVFVGNVFEPGVFE
jgi:hypothetical protein